MKVSTLLTLVFAMTSRYLQEILADEMAWDGGAFLIYEQLPRYVTA